MTKIILFYIMKTIFVLFGIGIILLISIGLFNSYNNQKNELINYEKNQINLSQNKETLYNCKISAFDDGNLNNLIFHCGNQYEKLDFAKLTSVYFPLKGECGYDNSKKYLKSLMNFSFSFDVLYEKDNKKYGYLKSGKENYNETIIKKGYGKYKEDGLNIKALINAEKESISLSLGNNKNCK